MVIARLLVSILEYVESVRGVDKAFDGLPGHVCIAVSDPADQVLYPARSFSRLDN